MANNIRWMFSHLVGLLNVAKWRRDKTSAKTQYSEFVKGFKKKECVRFMPRGDEELSLEICHCGLEKSEHIPQELQENQPELTLDASIYTRSTVSVSRSATSRTPSYREFSWNERDCIRTFPTDTFGEIYINGQTKGPCLPMQYLRLSNESGIGCSHPDVLKLLKDYWYLLDSDGPLLAISITGETQEAVIEAPKREKFMSGLIKAAKSTYACFLTDGRNSGYTRLVGNVVRKLQSLVEVHDHAITQIKCIGIMAFGPIRETIAGFKDNNDISGEDISAVLNRDHTHLLLVDNGYSNENANADDFRARLLECFQKPPIEGLGIPVVVLALNGGASAIQECLKALRRNNPVVVVEGTGKAADLLAYAAKKYSRLETNIENATVVEQLDEDAKRDILEQVSQFLPEVDAEAREELAGAIAECCERGSLITIFNICSDSSLDKFILYAILKGQTSSIHQLELALEWDRVDVAEERIYPKIEEDGYRISELTNTMKKAILAEKEDFIELLLQKGFDMSKYMTVSALEELYNSAEADSHLRRLIRKPGNERISLSDVHGLFIKLAVKHSYELYSSDAQEKKEFEDPYLELFLWSVVSRRDQLAMYLWKKCQSLLLAAILATCLYRSLRKSLSVRHIKLKIEYLKMKNMFEKNAVELVDNCFRDDRDKALRLVEQKSHRWGDLHLLDLALIARDRRFIATVCCQESIQQRWNDIRVKFFVRQMFRIIITFLHFYLVLFHLVYSLSVLEIILLLIVIAYMIEKGFEISYAKSIKLWLSAWNIYDIATEMCFMAGFAFRMTQATFFLGKIFYSLCAMLFCCRLFRFFYINTKLGPMILIFIYMIPKLLQFLVFLVVMLLGYGITSMALMNHPCQTRSLIKNTSGIAKVAQDIIFNPYWEMFGELELETIEETNWKVCLKWTSEVYWNTSCVPCVESDDDPECYCLSFGLTERCTVKLLLAFYLIIGNVLLLNLIIAIFTNVFEQVQQKSSEHWKFEMYRMAIEYDSRPILPPPFGPFVYLWRMRRRRISPKNKIVNLKSNEKKIMLSAFEYNKAQDETPNKRSSLSDQMAEMAERLRAMEETLSNMMADMQEARSADDTLSCGNFTTVLERSLSPFDRIKYLPNRINYLEEHLRASQRRLEQELGIMMEKLQGLSVMQGELLNRREDQPE